MKSALIPKILVLSTVHNYRDARIFYKEIPSIQKKYSELIFLVKNDEAEPGSVIEVNNIQIRCLPNVKSFSERIFRLQKIAYKTIKEMKPDLVHFHDPELLFLMYLVKIRFGCKIIFDIHENVSESIKDHFWLPKIIRPVVKLFYRMMEKFLIRKFEGLVIAEESYRNTYGEGPVVVRNYPLVKDTEEIEKNFSAQINISYTGGVFRRRGALEMLRVFYELNNKYDNLFFHLIGRVENPELQNEIENFIAENNLTDKVKVYGFLGLDKVYSILRDCHIGFSLMAPIGNYVESLSTKIFDYMKYKVVPVVSDFKIYEEFITEPETGVLVNYFDIKEIVRNIETLIENPELMKKYGENGYNNLMKYWNWEIEEKKLLALYDEILN